MTPIKFKEQMKARFDKKQTILAPETETGVTERQPEVRLSDHSTEEQVLCPFCLHIGKIKEFLVSTKKGISQYRAKCPECQNGMLIRSLLQEMTVEEYAEWVYNYVADGFWQKCKWYTWKDRLAKLGMAAAFWTKYKQLKGEDTTESYEDYIIRKQYEQAKEEGWTEQ